jgi:hypothetical protein
MLANGIAVCRYVRRCDRDFAKLAKTKLAETEGFEPSIGLYNPITV